MFKNYLVTSWRNIQHNKFFSLIHVLGLSIGISAALVIYLLVHFDFSFDRFHKEGNRIYRVVTNFDFAGEKVYNSGVTVPLGDAMRKEVSGLSELASLYVWATELNIRIPEAGNQAGKLFKKQEKIVFADAHYFNLFQYNWLAGSPDVSLKQPLQVVLTTRRMEQYFPHQPVAAVMGKTIYFNDSIAATVSGVVKEPEANSDVDFGVFVSYSSTQLPRIRPYKGWNNWGSTNSNSQLFVKLSPGTKPAQIERQLPAVFKKHYTPEPDETGTATFVLQPLAEMHFDARYRNVNNNRVAHKPVLYGLLSVAAFLLLLACINFINLSTAQAVKRAKEIGVRKTMGSSKIQLIGQFLSETLLLTFIATLLSVLLTPLLLKVFAGFIPDAVHFNPIEQPHVFLFLGILIVLVSCLSGIYPALVLSAYQPIQVLKNQLPVYTGKTRAGMLRRVLTTAQFVIAQVFIMATILVGKQTGYSLSKDMGFRKDAILYFHTRFQQDKPNAAQVLVQQLRAVPGIALVSLSNDAPSINGAWSTMLKYHNGKEEVTQNVHVKAADTNYIHLYNIPLLAGRNLQPSDTVAQLLINNTYAKMLGFRQPEKAVGQYLKWDEQKPVPVVGVIADFHQNSLHDPIKPLLITSDLATENCINVLLQPQGASGTSWNTTIRQIEKAWKQMYPQDDFTYFFLDDSIARFYKTEQNLGMLLRWCTGLAIFISCLGLLGLVIYTANQRTKEIGIRKILGATVTQLIVLVSKDFVALVLLAFVIAAPAAWWGMHQWLQNFAYHTTISWWIFVASGLLMLLMALLVLSLRLLQVATANPVNSLRTE